MQHVGRSSYRGSSRACKHRTEHIQPFGIAHLVYSHQREAVARERQAAWRAKAQVVTMALGKTSTSSWALQVDKALCKYLKRDAKHSEILYMQKRSCACVRSLPRLRYSDVLCRAGRDFHVFNVLFRNNDKAEVRPNHIDAEPVTAIAWTLLSVP